MEDLSTKSKKNNIKDFFKKIYNAYLNVFSSWKKTFIFLFVLLALTSAVILLIFNLGPNTFYNCNSDDIIQYYPFVDGFFKKIKSGNFSLYDTTLFGGVSIFANTYYIPIDIFLFIAFILSFFMETEFAYWFSLIVKVCCGAMLFFYYLKRKNINKKAAVISSLIFASCGLLECYVIFPVYLGVMVYAPLGRSLVDYFFDKNRRNISLICLPLYVVQVVVFDYYVAYMLLAFISVFYLIEATIRNKNFLSKKEFYFDFIKFFLFLLLGVLMSLSILVPSALYVLHQSSRNNAGFDYPWIFTLGSHKSISSGISWRHYFTQLCNIFIPNNPPEVCLVKAGDYVREHASLYMTCGGLIYFVRFFFVKGNNKLKVWTLVLNIMFMIPLFSFIFSLQKVSYVRWFFIPYILNLYATSIGMSEGFILDKNKVESYAPIIMMILGLVLISYVLITNPEIFIHYEKTDSREYKRLFFYGITIGSIVFISIYLICLVYPHIIKGFKPNKELHLALIPKVIYLEMIFALVICMINIGSTSYSSTNTYRAGVLVNYLKNNSTYSDSNMDRINLYTDEKFQANANTIYNNVNPYNFFQSFYNTPLNTYQNEIHGDSTTSWSRRNMYGYTLFNGPMLNINHVISIGKIGAYINSSDTQDSVDALRLPDKYYSLKKDTTLSKYKNNATYYYYSLKNPNSFIVYDKVTFKSKAYTTNNNSFYNDSILLNYGYISLPSKIYSQGISTQALQNIVSNRDNFTDLSSEEYTSLVNASVINDIGIQSYAVQDLYKKISSSTDITHIQLRNATYLTSGYFVYDLTNEFGRDTIVNSDMIYVEPNNKKLTELSFSPSSRSYMYIRDKNTKKLHPFHYNVGYIEEIKRQYENEGLTFEPDLLYVKTDMATSSKMISLYCTSYSVYDSYLDNQNKYTNRHFNFDNSNIDVSFDNPEGSSLVIKLPATYSNEWIADNTDYKVVNIDGGFLGVTIPAGHEKVSFRLKFMPEGYSKSFKVSMVGSMIYLSVTSLALLNDDKRRVREMNLWKQSR